MSIANYGIMLMSGYEWQKSSETTCEYNMWFILNSYLDAFHTHSDASIIPGCDYETWVLWSYKCRVILWPNYNQAWHLVAEYCIPFNSWPAWAIVGFSSICWWIVLSSLQPTATFQQVEDTHQEDIAFKYFQFHLNQWLTEELRVHNLRPQDAPPVLFQSSDEVYYFNFIPLSKLKTK